MSELAAKSWAFRWGVELHAARAFHHLSRELEALAYPRELVDACAKAARDEERHAQLCEEIARHFGATEAVALVQRDSLAPMKMPREQAAIYDLVARCCVGETESTATVVSLLPLTKPPAREVVQIIARDEVEHARLGWRALAYLVEQKRDLAFVGAYLPDMLEPGAALFERDASEEEELDAGVFGIAKRRALFIETLEEVIFPGLDLVRVPTKAARAWLEERRAQRTNSLRRIR